MPIVLTTSRRSRMDAETVPSSAFATQTEPCPIARATGLRPTSTWPTTGSAAGRSQRPSREEPRLSPRRRSATLYDRGSLDAGDYRRLERRIVVEDGFPRRWRFIVRLEPEAPRPATAGPSGRPRARLPGGRSDRGQHQLAAQAFPQWLLAHEPLEPGASSAWRPSAVGLDPLLERRQPLLFQPRSARRGRRSRPARPEALHATGPALPGAAGRPGRAPPRAPSPPAARSDGGRGSPSLTRMR